MERSRRFYRDVLGLAIYREFGPADDPGMVSSLARDYSRFPGIRPTLPGSVMIWIQMWDVHAEHARLAAAAVPIIRRPATEPWGLTGMWIQCPMASGKCHYEPVGTYPSLSDGSCYPALRALAQAVARDVTV